METFETAKNLRKVFKRSIQQWSLSLIANGEDLGEVNGKRAIF